MFLNSPNIAMKQDTGVARPEQTARHEEIGVTIVAVHAGPRVSCYWYTIASFPGRSFTVLSSVVALRSEKRLTKQE